MESFSINNSELNKRFDPFFYKPYFCDKVDELTTSKHQIVSLSEICIKITDGTHFTPKYTEEGIPFLSVKDVRENQISFEQTKFITPEEHGFLIKRCKPQTNDILLTKVGTVGIAAVIPEDSPEFSIFVSVALLKIDLNKAYPHFVAAYLNSNLTKFQIDRVVKGIGVPDLHLEDIANIKIPLPSLREQKKIVESVQKAYNSKKQKEAEADELLASISNYVLSELGIEFPEIEETKTFVVFANEIEDRQDSFFYKPEFKELRKSLKAVPHVKLGNLVEFSKETWNQKEGFTDIFPYIEIGEIDTSTGDILNINHCKIEEAPSRARMVVRENDIIVSTTRPNRGAISLIDISKDGFIASTGFAILRNIKHENLSKTYLYYFLRTRASLHQMLQRSSGGNYPAITIEQLKRILIPVPPKDVQDRIAAEVATRLKRAKQLRREALEELEKAKQEAERLILGE